MKKKVLILLSDPCSINSEILEKSFFFFNKENKNKYVIIGDLNRLSNKNIIKKKSIEFINISNNFNTKKYLIKSFDIAFNILKNKKANALLNLPLDKNLLPKQFCGFTEYVSSNFKCLGKETMLLYNENFSICPNTTHIPIKKISSALNQKLIFKNIYNINLFYKKIIGLKKPKIAIMGLNPHNGYDFNFKTEEHKIIIPSIKLLKKKNITIDGPLAPDSAFNQVLKKKINCLVGNYHDQVLPTFKYIHKFNAINITLGLPFLRISPDHGTAKDIKNKNLANPDSLIYALNFFEKYSSVL